MAYLPTSMVNLVVRPPMLKAGFCSVPSQLLKFYYGGDWPQCQAPQGDLEDLLRREVGATSVWHAISFGSLNAAFWPGRK